MISQEKDSKKINKIKNVFSQEEYKKHKKNLEDCIKEIDNKIAGLNERSIELFDTTKRLNDIYQKINAQVVDIAKRRNKLVGDLKSKYGDENKALEVSKMHDFNKDVTDVNNEIINSSKKIDKHEKEEQKIKEEFTSLEKELSNEVSKVQEEFANHMLQFGEKDGYTEFFDDFFNKFQETYKNNPKLYNIKSFQDVPNLDLDTFSILYDEFANAFNKDSLNTLLSEHNENYNQRYIELGAGQKAFNDFKTAFNDDLLTSESAFVTNIKSRIGNLQNYSNNLKDIKIHYTTLLEVGEKIKTSVKDIENHMIKTIDFKNIRAKTAVGFKDWYNINNSDNKKKADEIAESFNTYNKGFSNFVGEVLDKKASRFGGKKKYAFAAIKRDGDVNRLYLAMKNLTFYDPNNYVKVEMDNPSFGKITYQLPENSISIGQQQFF